MDFKTKTGTSSKNDIQVYGFNLTEDLVGNITLADMAFLGAKHRKPTENESKMLNALLVAICEHGFTPSSISTRLTYLGAPEAVQASIASGLLGAGTVYLGAMENVAELLQTTYQKHGDNKDTCEMAATVLKEQNEAGLQIPGFGHPVHKPKDPRTTKLFEIAGDLGFYGKHSKLLTEIHRQFCVLKGKTITLNAVGAIGAIMADMDMDYRIVKSFAVASRAVGLVAHVVEEIETGRKEGAGQQIFDYVESHTNYEVIDR
ncbi:citryl-CoA lyase [Salicibibacter halophilus]|uniref:citrate synthase (unknown stereospecificity) n=1 Tax=Salicibibacter halophilus TaxID=2502791 RepID=A0A514LEP7_9BACI|nr:citryl-CoA lyase [Salicibibacter halophilus]QDI90336.1 citryl-CoA lyase [Salicibibacter halophilus]